MFLIRWAFLKVFLSVFRAEFFLQHFPIRPLKYGSRFGHVFFQCVVLGNRGMFYFLFFFLGFFMRSSGQQDYIIKNTRKKKLYYRGVYCFFT